MSEREPVFNVPFSVVFTIFALVLVHLIRNYFLTDQANLDLLLVLSFIPARYTGTITDIPGGDISAVTSFVTYMFVHGDSTHLIINSVWLLAFGGAIAKRIGDFRFISFSLFCGIAGVLVHLVFRWGDAVPVIGASAAISGQMAGALRFFFGAYKTGGLWSLRNDPRSIPRVSVIEVMTDPRILVFLGVWVGLNVIFGLGIVQFGEEAGVAWEAHIGGFLAGLLVFSLFDTGNSFNRSVA